MCSSDLQTRGFRFKDHLDFKVQDSPLVVTGAETVPLTKRYSSGSQVYDRTVRKPIAPITLRRNTVAYVTFSLDTVTGIVTLTPDTTTAISSSASVAITGMTQANPGVMTTGVNHNFASGQQVIASAVVGMVEIRSEEHTSELQSH